MGLSRKRKKAEEKMDNEKEKEKEKDSAILSHLLFLDDEILKTDQHLEKLEQRIVLLDRKMAWIKNDCFESSIEAEPKIEPKGRKKSKGV